MTRRVKALAWFSLAVALFFAGAATIGGGIAGAVAWHRIPHETSTTVGTLLKTGSCGGIGAKEGAATFTVAGTTYDARADCNARLGDRVQIKYDPTDPTHNNDSYSHGAVWIALAAFFLVMLISAVRNAISLHRTPTLERPSKSRSKRSPNSIEPSQSTAIREAAHVT
jgi:hypothetical protein